MLLRLESGREKGKVKENDKDCYKIFFIYSFTVLYLLTTYLDHIQPHYPLGLKF